MVCGHYFQHYGSPGGWILCSYKVFSTTKTLHWSSQHQPVSADQVEFLAALELKTAGALIGACEKHIIPHICCLWGYMEYIHKVGKIPLEVVFARHMELDNLD